MQPIVVLYATREGQTRRIAQYIGDALNSADVEVEVMHVSDIPANFALDKYCKAIIAASVHQEDHEKEMVEFVRRYATALNQMPSAFISVSLSQAGAEDVLAEPNQRAKAAADVEHMIFRFLAQTGWHPSTVKPVAGALAYTRYNLVTRFMLKRIAKLNGASTDTTRDHEFTDWKSLDSFLADFRLIPVPV